MAGESKSQLTLSWRGLQSWTWTCSQSPSCWVFWTQSLTDSRYDCGSGSDLGSGRALHECKPKHEVIMQYWGSRPHALQVAGGVACRPRANAEVTVHTAAGCKGMSFPVSRCVWSQVCCSLLNARCTYAARLQLRCPRRGRWTALAGKCPSQRPRTPHSHQVWQPTRCPQGRRLPTCGCTPAEGRAQRRPQCEVTVNPER